MSNLSPAAQAVLEAADYELDDTFCLPSAIAAALRAAVECYAEEGNGEGPQWFLAIAAELDGTNPSESDFDG